MRCWNLSDYSSIVGHLAGCFLRWGKSLLAHERVDLGSRRRIAMKSRCEIPRVTG